MKKEIDSIFERFSISEAYRFSNHSLLFSVTELFENVPSVMLREHYRCHPKIIEFCNKKFYVHDTYIYGYDDTDFILWFI